MKTVYRCALAVALIVATLAQANRAAAELIYGIAAVGNATNLVTWDSATPGNVVSATPVSGLQPNETIAGIDFRPFNKQLYALGSSNRLYTLNTATGAATQVGSPFALNGFNFGFDFNPVIDRIRVVAETNANYVLNPNTGAIQTVAPNVAYAAGDPNVGRDPNVVNSAYTNNFNGAASTTLYGIDTGLDVLVTQVAATGALSTVGSLNFDITAIGGFDISGVTGNAYASVVLAGESVSRFIQINLANGTPSGFAQVDGGLLITALTTAPIPEPATAALGAVALLGLAGIRRRWA
jgi:MYXO-CTERM domain-containing protein